MKRRQDRDHDQHLNLVGAFENWGQRHWPVNLNPFRVFPLASSFRSPRTSLRISRSLLRVLHLEIYEGLGTFGGGNLTQWHPNLAQAARADDPHIADIQQAEVKGCRATGSCHNLDCHTVTGDDRCQRCLPPCSSFFAVRAVPSISSFRFEIVDPFFRRLPPLNSVSTVKFVFLSEDRQTA